MMKSAIDIEALKSILHLLSTEHLEFSLPANFEKFNFTLEKGSPSSSS